MAAQDPQGERTEGKQLAPSPPTLSDSGHVAIREPRFTLSDAITDLNKLVTIAAVIVAGIWTYKLFVEHREAYARANLQHEVTIVGIDDERRLLRLDVVIQNTGNIILPLRSAQVRIERVLPLSPRIEKSLRERVNQITEGPDFFPWPAIRVRHSDWKDGEFELEPSENDDTHYEFVISSQEEVLNIYTHFDNSVKQDDQPGIGWDHSTLIDLRRL